MREIREKIQSSRMSRYQWVIVAVCVLLNAQDGFDISAVAYASTAITEEWGLSGTELGTVISSGLLGIVIGAFVLSPVADSLGRRVCIQFGLAMTAIGMFLGSGADTAGELTLWRFVTGLGIGGVTAAINVVVAEYTNLRWRGMSIGIYTAGFGIGATIGGLASAGLLDTHGWRSIFVLGGINSVVSMLLVLFLLPQSVEFLAQRKGKRALPQINRILARIQLPPVSSIDHESGNETSRSLVREVAGLFHRTYRARTLLLWVAFFTAMFAFYFLSGWTPRLATIAGHDVSFAALAGSILSIGGSIGAIGFGLMSHRSGVTRLLLIFTGVGAIVFVALGFGMPIEVLLLGFGFAAGLMANGVFVGLFTLAPMLYPARMRVTGVGWANGVGRTGSILAPLAVGALVDLGWHVSVLYLLGAALLFMTAGSIILYVRSTAVHDVAPETTKDMRESQPLSS